MEQTSATTPGAPPAQPDEASQASDRAASPTPPGFGARGRVRRRARFLRKARELAYRDLGGLVYSLHHFGQRNDSLVLAKLATLSRIDAELRTLEASLSERQPVTVLREAGITACPRCAAIHSGEDRFCPNCGLPMSRNVDLPIAGAAAPATAPAATASPATPVTPAPAAPTPSTSAPASSTPSPSPPSPSPPQAAPGFSPPAAPAPGAPAAPMHTHAEPSTQTHAAAPTQTHAAPATQTHAPVPPAEGSHGRSPVPPTPGGPPSAPASDDDQPTEIIRPPAASS